MARRLQAGLVAAALLASGCNLLLGLDPTTEVPADARPAPDAAVYDAGPPDALVPDALVPDADPVTGHDEDGDGVDDGLDVCPGLSDDQTDGDADGVGDLCDPNAGTGTEVLLYFDGFASDGGHWTGHRGTWMVSDDSLQQTDRTIATGLAVADYDLTGQQVTVEIVASIVDQLPWNGTDPSAERGYGLWWVVSGGSAASEPNGYLCQPRGDLATSTTTTTLFRQVDAVATLLDIDTVPSILPAGTVGRVRTAIPGGPGFVLCTITLGNDAIVATLFANDSTYSSGGIALRTSSAAVRFHSILIIGRN